MFLLLSLFSIRCPQFAVNHHFGQIKGLNSLSSIRPFPIRSMRSHPLPSAQSAPIRSIRSHLFNPFPKSIDRPSVPIRGVFQIMAYAKNRQIQVTVSAPRLPLGDSRQVTVTGAFYRQREQLAHHRPSPHP